MWSDHTVQHLALIIFLVFFLGWNIENYPAGRTAHAGSAPDPYLSARMQMVEKQIKARGVAEEKILEAFLKVERHRFVPERLRPLAYEDRPLPIGENQTISQPYVVAFMTDALHLSKTDRVLEIGTGSGYQAAVLAELCAQVFTIELMESLGNKAEKVLKDLGYENIRVQIGDGYLGWKEHAPYDAIIVTCAPSHVPTALQEQLKEGGTMIIPVGDGFAQELVLLQKQNNVLKQEKVLPVMFVPMVDETGKKY